MSAGFAAEPVDPEPVLGAGRIVVNLAALHNLLTSAFTHDSLRRFCQHRELFRPVLNDFSPDHGLNQMADRLIAYCEKKGLWAELLDGVQQESPRLYARLEPELWLVEPPGAPPAVESDPLPGILEELDRTVRAHAPPARRTPALEQVAALRQAALATPPDLAGLEVVLHWFEAKLPALSGAVLSAIGGVEPRAEAAGDEVLFDFWQRFGRFAGQ